MSRAPADGGPAGAPSSSSKGIGGFGVFDLTPHKIAVCHLIQVFAPPPGQQPIAFPFQSVSHHNRLGLFLFSLTRSCDGFLEPSLDELLNQLKAVGGMVNDFLNEYLINSLASLSSPDDLFNLFDKLRGVLATAEGVGMEDEQILLDPNSHLGVFLRCCILAFNLLSFEGVCHLLTNIGTYCKLSDSTYELPEDDCNSEPELHELLEFVDDTDTEHENVAFRKYQHSREAEVHVGEGSLMHPHQHRPIYGFTQEVQNPFGSKFQMVDAVEPAHALWKNKDNQGFLRSKWQVEGHITMQADLLEKNPALFPMNSLNSNIKQIKNLAPELNRVEYLQYLNALYHDDYLTAMDSLHCYYDYSAGMEGLFSRASSSPDTSAGRYETALLCLGTMHCQFGHFGKALESLTEAIRMSQQNNDDACLAYTLAAICNLLFKVGNSSTTGLKASPFSLGSSVGLAAPLSTQQQLLALLKMSLKMASSVKLAGLTAFNHLSLAKFELKHVKRPLLYFGPKTSSKLKTCPINVCKELRLSSHVLSEFGSEGASQPFDDAALSTSWIKNLSFATTPWIKDPSKSSGPSANDYDVFLFDAQPNPIPSSVLQLAGSSYLLRATSWELYGSAPLVRINALVYATCYADAASSADLSLAYVKLIQHLAVYKGYKETFAALKLAEEMFHKASQSHIHFLKLELLHERALHRGSVKSSQRVCDELGVLVSPATGVDMELRTQASIRQARTLLVANQFSQAAAVAHYVFCTCYKFNMHVENATVLLLLAEINKKSGNAVLAIPYALASLSFCQSFNLDLLEASASLMLAELWLSLGPSHAKRALSLVYRTLPMILGHGGLELRARAHIVLAKCHLSDPAFLIAEDPSAVLDPLSQAADELQILEFHELAAEAFYLTAIVCDKLGRFEDRERAAASFRDHVLALENPEDEEDPLAYPPL